MSGITVVYNDGIFSNETNLFGIKGNVTDDTQIIICEIDINNGSFTEFVTIDDAAGKQGRSIAYSPFDGYICTLI